MHENDLMKFAEQPERLKGSHTSIQILWKPRRRDTESTCTTKTVRSNS